MKSYSAHSVTPRSQVRDSKPQVTLKEKPKSTKLSENDREFIRAMNEFVEEHGTITDDEYFRVL
jgi:hypothetical protein